MADPAEASEETDPAAAAAACIAWGGGGEGEWLWSRCCSRCGGGTALEGGIVSRCKRAASWKRSKINEIIVTSLLAKDESQNLVVSLSLAQ